MHSQGWRKWDEIGRRQWCIVRSFEEKGIPLDLVKLACEEDRNQSVTEGRSNQQAEKPQWSNQGPQGYILTMWEGAKIRQREDTEWMQKELENYGYHRMSGDVLLDSWYVSMTMQTRRGCVDKTGINGGSVGRRDTRYWLVELQVLA